METGQAETTNRDKQGLQSLEAARNQSPQWPHARTTATDHVPGLSDLTPSPRPPAGTHVLGLLALAWPTSPASFLTTPLLPTRQPQVPEPPTPLRLLHTPNPAIPPIPNASSALLVPSLSGKMCIPPVSAQTLFLL